MTYTRKKGNVMQGSFKLQLINLCDTLKLDEAERRWQ